MANIPRPAQAPLPFVPPAVVAPPPPPPASDPNNVEQLDLTEESPAFQLDLESPDTDPDLSPYIETRQTLYRLDDEDPEFDLKSSAGVLARRARFTQIVTTVVGALWIFCQMVTIHAAARTILFD